MHSITDHAQFRYSVSDIHYICIRGQFEKFYLFLTATFLCQVQGSIKPRFRFYFLFFSLDCSCACYCDDSSFLVFREIIELQFLYLTYIFAVLLHEIVVLARNHQINSARHFVSLLFIHFLIISML